MQAQRVRPAQIQPCPDLPAQRDRKVSKAIMARLDRKVYKVIKALLGPLVLKEIPARLVRKVIPARAARSLIGAVFGPRRIKLLRLQTRLIQ